MKLPTALFLAAISSPLAANAAALSQEDANALEQRIKKIYDAFENGNAETVIDMTHPSIFKIMGGKEQAVEMTKAALAQLKSMGYKTLENKFGTPTETYLAADELVCFYPKTTVVAVQGKKARSTSYFICVRKAEGGEWLFMDASGLQKNPELLKTLLPALPADAKLPENKVELVD